MSGIVAFAFMIIQPEDFNIEEAKLELPDYVKMNLKEALLPYLRGIGLFGYSSEQKRKVFALGNTGKSKCFIHSFKGISNVNENSIC